MGRGGYNAASPGQVAKAKRAADRTREEELLDVRYLLDSKQGRRFLWRYLEQCGIFRTSFTGNSQTFFNEGKRNIGLMLMSDITEANPERYLDMMREAKERDDARSSERAKVSSDGSHDDT